MKQVTTFKNILVESMSIDKEIKEFLWFEREVFKKRKEAETSCQEEEICNRKTKELKSTEMKQRSLRERWKEGKKEIKLACHNMNELKTKGWKLENLLS